MEPLSLKLFGDVKLTRGPDGDIQLPRKTQMLLAYLASDAGKEVPRDKLAGLIWADRPEEQARHSLRQCLFTLAKAIGDDGPSIVVADRRQVSLDPDLVEVDTWRFERLLADDTPEAIGRACALYGDDFLAGVGFEDETLDAWCSAERTRLRELCYESLAKLSSLHADTARLDEAIEAGRRLVALDPLREDGHRALMRLFSRAGRRADALKQYRLCRDTLKAELNVEPETATTNLYADIRGRSDDAKTAPETAAGPPEVAPSADEPSQATVLISTRWKPVLTVAGLILTLVLAATLAWLAIGDSSGFLE